jgi:hypothetical protein
MIKGADWWQYAFFDGYTYQGRDKDSICFFVTCPHWLLAVSALILPVIWFWRRRNKIVLPKNVRGS